MTPFAPGGCPDLPWSPPQTSLSSDLRGSIPSPAFNNRLCRPEMLPRRLREVGTGPGSMASWVVVRLGTCEGRVLKRGLALVDQLHATPVDR